MRLQNYKETIRIFLDIFNENLPSQKMTVNSHEIESQKIL